MYSFTPVGIQGIINNFFNILLVVMQSVPVSAHRNYNYIMRGETYNKHIAGFDFTFEKLLLKNNEPLFFVTSNMPGERSFFMSKMDGKWQVLYHQILGKEVLKLENQLAEAIAEAGY